MRFAALFLALLASAFAAPIIDPPTTVIKGTTITLAGANDVFGTKIGPYDVVPAQWKGQLKKGGPFYTIIGVDMQQISTYLEEIGVDYEQQLVNGELVHIEG
jgi:hypothetical protein